MKGILQIVLILNYSVIGNSPRVMLGPGELQNHPRAATNCEYLLNKALIYWLRISRFASN